MSPNNKKPAKIDYQAVCDGIYKSTGALACYVVNDEGALLGFNYGEVVASEKLRSRYPVLVGVVWGSLKNIEEAAGRLSLLEATYDKFKVLGIPIPGTRVAVLLTVAVGTDSQATKSAALDFALSRLAGS